MSRFRENSLGVLSPGQGVQQPGMGEAIYQTSEEAKRVFDAASEVAGFDMAEVCFGSETDRLEETLVAQQAITTVNIADHSYLKKIGINFDIGVGHSLGEMPLLAMSGILSVKDTLSLVKSRAIATSKAAEERPGEMLIVSGLEKEDLSSRLQHILSNARTTITNFNGIKQNVLSGDRETMSEIIEHLRNLRLQERLRVSFERVRTGGAFHHPWHMEKAAEEFHEAAKEFKYNQAEFDLMLNSARYLSEVGLDNLAEYLSQQLVKPVDFVGSARRIISDGITNFLEVGDKPKEAKHKVLSGLLNRDFGNIVHIIEIKELGASPNGQKTS